ncbi:DUF1501 domain-containing protein [Nocardioides sp. zg-ZUI104]|uniref:DUF1501 domain-containing protein n=1 Tax=Nocardioides faecalis TaxID=2803858 RepID=UPI001BD1ABDA|nr:DUF1501 domain-containing protein [Nocardioides faecalis]MBS4753796.1 DUF1501 domain-containing protein [Nocardioides faecalis]
MTPTSDDCCADARRTFSRRGVLAAAAAAAGVAGLGVFGDTVRSVAHAAVPGTQNNVLVVVSLRGAIDGMGVVVPHGEAAYYQARPVIAVPKDRLLAADSMFGLHPSMAPLVKHWEAGTFAAVNATGLARPNRSHFAAMEEVEDANPGSTTRQGWVNRLLGGSTNALAGVHLTSNAAPTLISGPNPTVSAPLLSGIELAGANPAHDTAEWSTRRRSSLDLLWSADAERVPTDIQATLRRSVRQARQVAETLEGLPLGEPPAPAAAYDTSWRGKGLGEALADTARLIRADVGTSAVTLDFGNWDYHNDYGTLASGNMAAQLASLATNLDAFLTDLGPQAGRVTIVVMSEFGRRLTENSAHGLDHGWGNVMLLLGAGIRGGRYHGTWPGLTNVASSLVDDDVAVTTDYRDVLAEIVARRFPEISLAEAFPGFKATSVGVTT